MRISQALIWVLQFIISVLVIFLLVEILTTAKYTQAVSSYTQFTGLVGGIMMLILLLRQLIYSYKKYRSSLLLLYSLAIISMVSYLTIMAALTYLIIPDKPESVIQKRLNTHVYLPIYSIEWWLGKFVIQFQDVSFLMLWLASGFLLSYRFKKHRPMSFVFLLSIPVIYFLGRAVDIGYLVSIAGGNFVIESIVKIVVRSFSPLIGGLVFGLSFYYTSRSLPSGSKLRTYLNITGHGIVILLISSQFNTTFQYPYPPFGTVSIASTYMGAYLLLLGIYSTSLSSAQNIRIHNEISKIVQRSSKFSHDMGSAIFIDGIEKQVSRIEKGLEQESGVESASDEIEIKQYIKEIIDERKKHPTS